MFDRVYAGRKVLVTGHTGFKGSWLCLILRQLGAELCGVGLPMPEPNHFADLKLDMQSEICDINDFAALEAIFRRFQPECVFHLAAQALVRPGYRDMRGTFQTNVIGTLNVLECCRKSNVRAAVVVTSDKCYENTNLDRGYVESDPMGGYDPYSASKGCAELAVSSFRRSFCTDTDLLVATARAGNVIGGGDWAQDRLVPDLMRGALSNSTVYLRNPGATRPWQHVLEPLTGYLQLGGRLLKGDRTCACGWNFGPERCENVSVGEAAEALQRCWPAIRFACRNEENAPHEAEKLQLDCTKAHRELGFHSVYDAKCAFAVTAAHYRAQAERGVLNTLQDWENYCEEAKRKDLIWTR